MPSRNHGRVAQNLGVALSALRQRFDIYQQLSLDLEGWQSIPDIALFPHGTLSADWLTDEDPVTMAPALVIEILSPMQNFQPLVDKVREYLRHGVRSCWLVLPATKVVSVFPAEGGSRGFTEGVLQDDVLGIQLPLAAIFA